MSQQRGHLRREGRTWRLELRQASEPGGPRRRRSVRLGSTAEMPTRAAARRAADRWLDRMSPRQFHAGTVLEWSAWCDRYVDRCLPMLSKGSRTTQTSIVERHLRQAFPGPVHEVTAARVQTFLVEQRKAGAAPSSIRSRFAVLRRMLRQAAAEGLAAPPLAASAVTLPKDDRVHAAVRAKAFTPEEARRIREAATEPDSLAYELALFVGLRAGEVLGLEWSAIDLEIGTLEVRQQAVDGTIRPLKSRDSKATLRAPAPLLARLRAYRETWHPNPAGLLFADEEGRAWHAAALRGRLHALLEQLGIPRRGLHAFRHCCALSMARAGCNPEVIRRALRHSSLAITAIYLSAAPEDVALGLEQAASASVSGA
jgi:integrase